MIDSFQYMMQKAPGQNNGHDVRGKCPECGVKDSFTWAASHPHPYKCHSCNITGNAFTLGFRTEKKPELQPADDPGFFMPADLVDPAPGLSEYLVPDIEAPAAPVASLFDDDFSPPIPAAKPASVPAAPGISEEIARLVGKYHKKSKKTWRLSPAVIEHFKLYVKNRVTSSGRVTPAIAINGCDGVLAKWLSASKWMNPATQREQCTTDYWLNLENFRSEKRDRVYVVAGEWDLFTFWEHTGIDAISPKSGENHPVGKWKDEEAINVFSGKEVVIMYDNDETGRRGARNLAVAILRRVKTEWVKCVDLASLGVDHKGDLDDFFRFGKKERLFEEIDRTPVASAFIDIGPMPEEIKLEWHDKSWVIDPPQFKDSTLISGEDQIERVWRTGIKPAAMRRRLYSNLATAELGTEKVSEVKARVKEYEEEFQTMRTKAIDRAIYLLMDELHIKAGETKSDAEASVYYYYEDGHYKVLDFKMLKAMAEAITASLTPVDDDIKMQKAADNVERRLRSILLLKTKQCDFDNRINHGKVNVKNGIINMTTKELSQHTPDFHTTHQIPFDYDKDMLDPAAKCPNFMKSLDTWFKDNRTKEEFLKVCYYALSGRRDEHKAVIFYGTGENGKGEAAKLLTSLIGDERTASLRTEDLGNRHMLAGLNGKWLNISDEVNRREYIKDGIFKTITGDGRIMVDPKYNQPYSFTSKALWIILTNHQFGTSDNSHGMFRRLKYIKFERMSQETKVKDFFETCLKPELQAIFHFIIQQGEGLYRLQGGFKETQSDVELKVDLEEGHSVSSFWNEKIFVQESKAGETDSVALNTGFIKPSDDYDYIPLQEYYQEYRDYVTDNGFGQVNKTGFMNDSRNHLASWMNRLVGKKATVEFYMKPKYNNATKKTERRCVIVTSNNRRFTDLWSEFLEDEDKASMSELAQEVDKIFSGQAKPPGQEEDVSFEEHLKNTFGGTVVSDPTGGVAQ